MKKKWIILSLSLLVVLALSGCGKSTNNGDSANRGPNNGNAMSGSDMKGMDHSGSGKVPAGLKAAPKPTFKVGSQATIKADHMAGMNGAKATIVGAYSTIVYAVSYTPTIGGERVTNHKWVIQEELKDAGNKTFKLGDEVVLQADHMKGMDGAKATIDSAEQTTVYMVDYMPTTGGQMVKNHQWVTESELTNSGTASSDNMGGMKH
ncbi:YdhK family protein [Paenibacillus thalictri]|uniref:DUF1541 domain-containing protein n=1 Tax=Paenibacillus thalictri TaxID=2527873 RepID=A0A4Q9DH73_9BACL|nr:YdhK family protein [Paenibacillus thalictri]TBL69070.1 DUF1541 domain-containing protein [Paenibacillus thalictri]